MTFGDSDGPDDGASGATSFGGQALTTTYGSIPYFPGLNAPNFTITLAASRTDWSVPTVAEQTLVSKSWGYRLTQEALVLRARLNVVGSDTPVVLEHSVGGLGPGWHTIALTHDGATFSLLIDGAVAASVPNVNYIDRRVASANFRTNCLIRFATSGPSRRLLPRRWD